MKQFFFEIETNKVYEGCSEGMAPRTYWLSPEAGIINEYRPFGWVEIRMSLKGFDSDKSLYENYLEFFLKNGTEITLEEVMRRRTLDKLDY